ncbi:hypothetical protein NDU88_008393 [Pleurodeles waltl]|uniref:Uncharacterized protein n=1 Tax=Pleurodeles waltl TaxID=8319 RepID=A0AAV7QPR9_PLEWA|nr:hypothetical protein NDU88_008393 [Pleurodeles waltl]
MKGPQHHPSLDGMTSMNLHSGLWGLGTALVLQADQLGKILGAITCFKLGHTKFASRVTEGKGMLGPVTTYLEAMTAQLRDLSSMVKKLPVEQA